MHTDAIEQRASVIPADPFAQDNFLGVVYEVHPSAIGLMFGGGAPDGNTRSVVRTAEVGELLVVGCGDLAVIGQLQEVRQAEVAALDPATGQAVRRVAIVGQVRLVSTLDLVTGGVSSGVILRPRINDPVYLCPPGLVQYLAESGAQSSKDGRLVIHLARLPESPDTLLHFSPENIFGRHCAVLGATGSGKSNTVARLVEESAKFRSKVVVIDATGEFRTLSRNTLHVFMGDNPTPPEGAKEVSLPYYQLTESDLFAIFRPTGQGQAPKLRAAIKSLKLSNVAPSIALDGTIIKANKEKLPYETEYRKHYSKVEEPSAHFDVTKLVLQINNECVHPNRSALEPQYWGDINGVEQSLCIPLINRVQDIITSPNLRPVFNPGEDPSVLEVIDRFIEHPTFRVLCISMQYLSFAHMAREIVANAIGRYLLKLAREERFVLSPLVICIDEAHQFLNVMVEDGTGGAFPLDSFSLIAKEGRKYGLTTCLSTQRPRDIPENVLSQMGTLIVHRLINDKDRFLVERASGGLDRSSLEMLPSLAPGHALLVGVDFPMPMAIKVERPRAEPVSRGPDYQRFWR